MNYDVIFIGSGHAAWHGAQTLARSGKKSSLSGRKQGCWYMHKFWL